MDYAKNVTPKIDYLKRDPERVIRNNFDTNYSRQGNRRRSYKCITIILTKVIEEEVINVLQIFPPR